MTELMKNGMEWTGRSGQCLITDTITAFAWKADKNHEKPQSLEKKLSTGPPKYEAKVLTPLVLTFSNALRNTTMILEDERKVSECKSITTTTSTKYTTNTKQI
jgi:hypothetical protein